MKKSFFNASKIAVLALPFLLTGCMSSMSMGSPGAKTTATGSAAGSSAHNTKSGLT